MSSEGSQPRVVAALVRHGAYRQPPNTPSARLPHPLTDAGRDHARRGAALLAELAATHGLALWPVIDSSRLLRAWETATLLGETLRGTGGAAAARTVTWAADRPPTVEEFDALNERSVGSAANLTLDEVRAVIEADPRYRSLPEGWKSNSTHRLPLPGAESLVESGARVAAHLERRMFELAGTASRDTLKIFVGHGGAFRHAAAALGLLDLTEIPHLSMHHGRPILLERRGDGTWRHIGGPWKIRPSHPDPDARRRLTDPQTDERPSPNEEPQ